MNKSEPVFPREAMQMAQDPMGCLEVLVVVTEELPFTHRSDWIIVDAMRATITNFIQNAVQEAAQKSQAEQQSGTDTTESGLAAVPDPPEDPGEGTQAPEETPPPGVTAVDASNPEVAP